jgi:hypothetical protein
MQGPLLARYPDLEPARAYGERSFFVNPGGRLPRGAYFATIKGADGPNDRASRLDRDGVWRLSFGLPKPTFDALFGPPPARPPKGGVVAGPWGFAVPDLLMPHPVYGWMRWAAIVRPRSATLDALAPFLDGAHDRALRTARRRLRD